MSRTRWCGSEILSGFPGGQIFPHHQSHLKYDGVVKLTQIQTSQLLDLLKAVHQGVPVDKELTGGFGYIQIVLKELVDGEQSFLIQRINGVLLKYFRKEDVTQCGGKLINQSADTEIFIPSTKTEPATIRRRIFEFETSLFNNGGRDCLINSLS